MAWPSTVSVIEVLWTAPSVLGLLLTAWMCLDIWGDRRALLRSRWNGLALLQVNHWLRSETLVLVIHAIMALIGLFAMTQPASPSAANSPSLLALVLTAMFVAIPAMLMVRSIGDRVVRGLIRRERREETP